MTNWCLKRYFVFLLTNFHYCHGSISPETSKVLCARSTRHVLTTCLTGYLLLAQNNKKSKAVELGAKESIANVAQYIPGFGQPDVYYPPNWFGFWHVRKSITEISSLSPSLSQVSKLKQFLNDGSPLEYDNHFVLFNNKVILDRAYSLTSYYRNLYKDDNIITTWNPADPNIIYFSNGIDLVRAMYLILIVIFHH